jgi:Uma2 family endonuclease
MSIAVPAPPAPPAELRLKQFTVDEYDQFIREGSLAESLRVELLDGWIVEKMPHNAPHDSSVTRLQRRLMRLLGDDWIVRAQSSARLDTSVPEPDVAVVPGPEDRYDRRRPTHGDLALVVEVAESSLAQDRGFKLRLYARNKVPVYWIVNLIDRRIEVYMNPRGGRVPTYRTRTEYARGTAVPVVVAGKAVGTIPVNEVLP